MANLANVEAPTRSVRRRTANRDSIIPARRQTGLPDLEINARIHRPNNNEADELKRVLNLVEDTAESFTELAGLQKAKKDLEESSQAALDQALGVKNETRFEDSKAYRAAYRREAAISMATEVGRTLTESVNSRLADEDDPATLEDIDELIDSSLRKAALDETTGRPLDFGGPRPAAHLARAFLETRLRLRTEAAKVIMERSHEKLVDTGGMNYISEIVGEAPGFGRGPQLGAVEELEDHPGLAPFSSAQSPRAAAPTGRLPVRGSITNTMAQHARRGSIGVDIDGQIGDPVEAPAAARVKKVGRDGRSGNYVVLDHGGGVESSYAHLSRATVKQGDMVAPGDVFAAVGNTGNVSRRAGADGSHLHYRIRVKGKDVDPLTFRFSAGGPSQSVAAGERAQDGAGAAAVAEPSPRINFEEALNRVTGDAGNRVPRDFAKKRLLQVFVVAANDRNDPSLLDGLWLSKRADGSPSFTPDEMLYIQNARDVLRNKVRVEAERSENERFEKNHEAVLEEFVQGQEPTIPEIREMEAGGHIRPSFALSLINNIEAEEKAEIREQRQEAKEAQLRADNDMDYLVAVEADALKAGAISGVSTSVLQRRFERGEFGEGRRAIARYKALANALRQGGEIVASNPEAAGYAKQLEIQYGPKRTGNGSFVMEARGAAGGRDPVAYAAMVAHYRQLVKSGISPAEAYIQAVQKYSPKEAAPGASSQQRRSRIADLERKAAGR
jgi:murein DD-endopeptidase MepM/ murein hydrolase activator NlpD